MGDRPVGVAFRTLGCKVNRVESDSFAAALIGRGCAIVAEDDADVVVVNTCTVTGEADAKARKAVRHALRSPAHPVVVVTGCLAAIDAEGLRALSERVVVETDKERVSARVADILELDDDVGLPAVRAGAGFRTRALVKVQDGCDDFCTYCIVPHARGVPRSVPVSRVLEEVRALVDAGVSEVVLTGINLGRYADGDTTLPGLVESVAATGVARLRISSVEPRDLTDGLLDVIASVPAVCEHVHLPLQSGSDPVLRRMGRPYTTAEFARIVGRARAAIPGVAVTTDVIAGFPGETADEAEDTRAFCEEVGFSRLHVFRYSERAGTPAASAPDQVPKAERAARASALRELDAELRDRFESGLAGREVEVLVERVSGGRAEGTTREYVQAAIEGEAHRPGDIVRTPFRGVER